MWCRVRLPGDRIVQGHDNLTDHDATVAIYMSCGCCVTACTDVVDTVMGTFGACPICSVVIETLFCEST